MLPLYNSCPNIFGRAVSFSVVQRSRDVTDPFCVFPCTLFFYSFHLILISVRAFYESIV
jgi:hypothetical protein